MTPQQTEILAYIQERSPEVVRACDISAAISPHTDVKLVHVQVWNLREQGVSIHSKRGRDGGYWIPA